MAKKKILFYSINVRNKETLRKIDNSTIKDLIFDIIKENSIEGTTSNHLMLEEDKKQLERTTMDILENDENYLFARLGKIRGNGDILERNLQTYQANSIANETKRPEIYTYFLLDYNYGIIGFMRSNSMPKPDVIKNIFDRYNENYTLEIENILSLKTVNSLMKPGSELSRIKYSYKIPDVHILSDLGLDRETVAELQNVDYYTVDICIKNEPKKKLTKQRKTINHLIALFDKNSNIDNKIFKGNIPRNASRDYKFDIDNFSIVIDIPKDKIINGEIKIYSLEEISEEVKIRMKENYKRNRKHILRLSGIE